MKRTVVLAALLVALVFATYAPALRGGFIWDDDDHIYENAMLHDLSGLRAIWLEPGATMQYYPLTFTFFWGAYQAWGLDPLGFHLLNVAMHALTALLLWRLLIRLRVPWAFVGALLFALHPVNVMSVAWVTELKNTLSATLTLASCLAYLRFAGISLPSSRRWYAPALVLFALAMLAKTAVGFLPVTLGLIVWWKKDRFRWSDVAPLVPFVLLVAGMGAMTIVVERIHGGDVGHAYAMSLAQRAIVSGRSFWFYLGKLIVPFPLVFLYERWTIDARDALQYLPAMAALATAATLLATRARIGKGPFVAVAHFYLATSCALIFFVVTYFTRFSFVSDHWQYFGMASMAGLAAAGLARLEFVRRRAGRAAAVVAVGACFVLTWGRATVYRDVETLWRDTIAKSPQAWMAHNNLGVVLMRRGAKEEAIREYSLALRGKPDLVETHLNLGNLLAGTGQSEAAAEHYSEAVRLDPVSAEARFDFGRLLSDQGKTAEAVAQYEEAVRLRPDYAEAQSSLGVALSRLGRRSEALEHLELALQANPGYAEAHVNLGSVLAGAGRLDEAIAQYGEAVRIQPDDAEAHNVLGKALAKQGRTAEAVAEYEHALRLRPDLEWASNNLGLALATMDRWPEAIESFERALRTRPDFAEAHNNLGVTLMREQRTRDAIGHFEEAVRIRPDFGDARANLGRAQEELRAHPGGR